MKKQMPMPADEMMKESLRPSVSTPNQMKITEACEFSSRGSVGIHREALTGSDDFQDTIDTRGQERSLRASVADLERVQYTPQPRARRHITHRGKDGRGIVVDTVLSSPLLEEEDDEGDHEANPVTLAKECLLQAYARTRLFLLPDRCLDLCKLSHNEVVGERKSSVVSEVLVSFFDAAHSHEPSRRFLQASVSVIPPCEQPDAIYRTHLDSE